MLGAPARDPQTPAHLLKQINMQSVQSFDKLLPLSDEAIPGKAIVHKNVQAGCYCYPGAGVFLCCWCIVAPGTML